jgi:hypothetical protein
MAPETVREIALDAVRLKRAYQINADEHVVEAVKDAKAVGCTVREIQEAAGYKSPASIQKILAKGRA